jgi:hypothetical protein
VLFVLIPAAWLAVLFFAWAMCRLAALSDHARAGAPDERIGTSHAAEHESAPAGSPNEQPACDIQRGGYRAAG